MFPLFLHSLLASFMSDEIATKILLCLPAIVLVIWLWLRYVANDEHEDSPAALPECTLFTIIPFFRSRFDFIARGFELTGQPIFQFNLLRHKLIVLSGTISRREFFVARGFDLNAGFKVLSGALPMLPGITSDLQSKRVAQIYRRLANLQTSEKLECMLPKILEDLRKGMEAWSSRGQLDPFEEFFKLTFQSSVRCIAAAEVAEDPETVARLRTLYDRLDTATTPASVLVPWFPSPSTVRKVFATKQIYDIISQSILARRLGGVTQDDTLQMLIDNEDDDMTIIGFTMGLLVAGARSTGTTASWMFTFLGGHSQWKEKVADEIRAIVADYTTDLAVGSTTVHPPNTSQPHSLSTLSALLSRVPLDAWEARTPILDAVIRETLRLAEPHTAMRRNLGPEVRIGGKLIPSGAFVMYPFSDVHLNAELYSDPWKFDPSRQECKMPFSFVGWGAGTTVCLGQRLAKLELKLLAALLVLGFDFKCVDKDGRQLEALPRPNWNDTLTCKPPKGSCYLKYEQSKGL